MEKLKADVVFKDFWRDNDRFASLFNAVVFEGKEVLRPESLQEADTEVSNLIDFKDYQETLVKTRDVVKKSAFGVDFVILGIENQMKVHYAMPLRVMLYDALGYLIEYQDLSRKNKQSEIKMSAEEFLSGIRKSDRLHPIISIVIYYGETPWDGPFSLKDMIVDMPEEIAKVFSDYKMNLMQVRESSRYQFRNDDVQTVFEISGHILEGRFDEIEKKYRNRDIKAELALMIGTITESEDIVRQAAKGKGEVMNMCTALEKLKKQGIEQGKMELIGVMLKKGCSYEDISQLTDISIETLKKAEKNQEKEAY